MYRYSGILILHHLDSQLLTKNLISMKNIFKIFILGATLSFTACSDSDALINQVLDTVDTESGAVLRTLVDFPDLVTATNPANNVINSSIEVQQGNGSFVPDFKEVNVYVQVFNDQEDVIRRANDTEYGLVAYVFSEDMKRALQVCERLDYGMVGLNRGLVSDPAAPFGGTKQSGLGREGGHEGMHEFMETQYISASW